MFSIVPNACFSVRVTVLRGRNIDQLLVPAPDDITGKLNVVREKLPDAYVNLSISGALGGTRRTTTINNDANPEWNETFEFLVDKKHMNVLEIVVKDEDYMTDDIIGIETYDIDQVPTGQEFCVDVKINDVAEIQLIVYCVPDDRLPEGLRISEDLCNGELVFLAERKKHVLVGLNKLLGAEKGPTKLEDVPTIAILGSGGGFRAMVGFSGVLKALFETGLLDCATFVAGLSGSTWCLSTLYSNPKFPDEYNPTFYQNELKKRIEKNPISLFLSNIRAYLTEIEEKKQTGQPVSFTDFYGLMLRDTLLTDTPTAKLSDQRNKLKDGRVPLPLYTCLHVKENVQSRVYHEWIEFSPFEAGLAKYGAFMDINNFGSKFYLGKIQERFSEYPLHYYQGIWGSAYCIQLRQLLWMMQTDKMDGYRNAECPDSEDANRLKKELENMTTNVTSIQQELKNQVYNAVQQLPIAAVQGYYEPTKSVLIEMQSQAGKAYSMLSANLPSSANLWPLVPPVPKEIGNMKDKVVGVASAVKNFPNSSLVTNVANAFNDGKAYFQSTVDGIKFSDMLNSISGRAATVFNHMRGLTLRPNFEEDCVDTSLDDDENFKGIREPITTEAETLYVVDAGLAFNSPFPPLARYQRGVQLYISFDFSDRPEDQVPPFKEILMAEEWAKKCGIPFPPVEKTVREKYTNLKEVQEYYLFRDDNNPKCPIVIHFVLINNKFKTFKAPGIPRQTEAEKEMANFTLFEDKPNPYSSFNFHYTGEQFDRLCGLTEFNTLLGIDLIKDVIGELVQRTAERIKQI